MKDFEFQIPTKIIFGNGVVNKIGEEASRFGKRALIVTDPGLMATTHIEQIQTILQNTGISVEIFSEIEPNPRDTSVDIGTRKANKFQADVIVGVGGGSAIDTAKAIGVLMKEGGRIQDFEGLNKVGKPITPLIAVPTTAGTGTEVTFWAVITDTKRKFKMSIGSPLMAAKIALVDPTMTLTLPASITAFTGIDALVHSIEGYTATLSQPISDSLALSAIEIIGNNIRQAYANGNNLEARYSMMLGSMLAGMSFGNSDVAAVHCMGEAMGGLYDTPHGLSMAVCLPHCMEYNLISNPKKFTKIAEVLGENIQDLSLIDAAHQSVSAIKKLLKDLSIPSAKSIGLKKTDLKFLSKAAAANVAVESNPRIMRQEDFHHLFEKVYSQD